MNSRRSVNVLKRHLVWLVWLALLLPVAQAAANWHALSHVARDTAPGTDDPQALHLTHCDLCLTAAAVSGGALASEPPPTPSLAAARYAVPQAAPSGVRLAFSAPAYLSRAPPLAPL